MSRVTGVQADIAREFAISPATVCQWRKKGMPVREDGLYDLDAIRDWHRNNIKSSSKRKKRPTAELAKVWGLAKHGNMGMAEISRATGMSVTKVANILQYMDAHKDDISTFRDAKADIFAAEQLWYLSHITQEKLEGTAAKDLVEMAKKAYEKERIELGESTENVAVVVKHIREIKERQKLEEKNAG